LPLALVLADMENIGFEADADGIREFGALLEGRIDDLQRMIYESVGYEFNLNSPKQLAKALFEDLGLPARKKTKSGYSTNAEVLESLRDAHPAVSMLLDYRTLAKLKSTYCDGLLKVIGPDGRIHSSFNQTETRTGRISSTEPNLQNIPVRQELGRELRRFFRAREGWLLCDADYSQIELRVLAHMAQDTAMIDAFNSGTDIHRVTASQVFDVPEELVTPLMRSRAKAVNFGIVYGIGAHSLSQDIGVSYAEAKRYIDSYLAHYAGVAKFMDRMIEAAKERGYAETLFGRRRPLPELKASNAATRAFGERVARNMPIQGTAADIIKIAMVRVHRRLRDEGLRSRLILQVHDELIVEAPQEEAEHAARLLREEMEAAADLSVRLAAEVNVGRTWYDAKG
ncbi:MAG TPA: DNA polymerase I, partial [Firmicutes bacterium]|nr:DNA polymerase I [Bacillota bacterium]